MSTNKGHSVFLTGLILMLIAGSAALLLALVYKGTAERIESNALEKEKNGLKYIFPDSEDFVLKRTDPEKIYEVIYRGRTDGYVLSSRGKGYGGEIVLLVGITRQGTVQGIRVLSARETPGLGDKISEIRKGDDYPWFQAQYTGRTSDTILLGPDNIIAISGATISSRAVTEAVQKAFTDLDSWLNPVE